MQTPCQKCGKQFNAALSGSSGGVFRCPECQQLSALLLRNGRGEICFGDFVIVREVGQGSNAIVCKAQHVPTGEIRALKLFLAPGPNEAHSFREFGREATIATEIIHPNIIRVHEAGEHEGIPFVIMEFVAGLNMAQMLEEYGPLDQFDALTICSHICDALDHVWNNFMMVHRDIKPQNMILDKDGCVKVCDFGMIVGHDASMVDLNAVEGTPYYLSPECISAGAYLDNRADIYSLGASLYHMIAGVPPFNYGSLVEVVQARLREAPPDIREVSPTTHPEIAKVILTMMAKDPEERYNTAAECHDDIVCIKRGEPTKYAKADI